MTDIIEIGGLRLRFLQTKEDNGGSLDAFEMIVQPNARAPVPHYHESWDETIVGPMGVTTWRIDGKDRVCPAKASSSGAGSCTASATTRRRQRAASASSRQASLGTGYFGEMAALLSSGAPTPPR